MMVAAVSGLQPHHHATFARPLDASKSGVLLPRGKHCRASSAAATRATLRFHKPESGTRPRLLLMALPSDDAQVARFVQAADIAFRSPVEAQRKRLMLP